MAQLRLPPQRRLLLAGMILALALAALFWRHYAASRFVYAVSLEGTVLGAVPSETQAKQAVEKLAVLAPSGAGLAEQVTIQRVPVSDRLLQLTADELAERLQAAANRQVPAVAIRVAGQSVVFVADRETAQSVVDAIEADYRQALDAQAEVKQVAIKEQLTLADGMARADDVRTAEEAQRILVRGTDKLQTYTVQRGDTLWRIAEVNGLTPDDLSQANPGVKPTALQPGQELNLIVAEPYIHLESTEEVTVVENIPFDVETRQDPDRYPWQSEYLVKGVFGKRQVTYAVSRENGKVVERKPLKEEVLSDAKGAVFVQGTKLAPKLGSGQFLLPISGARLTSGFGWRGREFHPGLDLAAPKGTAIVAADDGTVVEAGWDGGYGYAVRIDHGEGKLVTIYGHLSSIAVKQGQTVKKGELIGYEGSTGRSTGPHLHFEVRRDGKAVDPRQFFPD